MAKEAANGNTSGFCKHYGGTAGAGKTVPAVFYLIGYIGKRPSEKSFFRRPEFKLHRHSAMLPKVWVWLFREKAV
ncbi:hypothetical protein BWD10_08770 [Neisseria zoodegmatis]|uniref:Uncharacterized protein n=1 Tax=Neisseria zoodegmatis TaxID=326523 RepID=A0ABX3WE17_9NEIS|nr:hypothetical protein BWD10_08770 [Neisseria zoodegmatis]